MFCVCYICARVLPAMPSPEENLLNGTCALLPHATGRCCRHGYIRRAASLLIFYSATVLLFRYDTRVRAAAQAYEERVLLGVRVRMIPF